MSRVSSVHSPKSPLTKLSECAEIDVYPDTPITLPIASESATKKIFKNNSIKSKPKTSKTKLSPNEKLIILRPHATNVHSPLSRNILPPSTSNILPPPSNLPSIIDQSTEYNFVRDSLRTKLLNRMPRKRLLHLNILRAFDFDPVLQQVMKNLMKQRMLKLQKFFLQRTVNKKLSNRESIQSLIRKGILKESNADEKDENTNNRRDMYRRMSNHSLTEFLTQRPTIDELVRASVVQDAMTWSKLVCTGSQPTARNCAQMVLNLENKMLYMMGGYGRNDNTTFELVRLDIQNKRWDRPMVGGIVPSSRYCLSCVNIKNQLIVFGGYSHKDGVWLNDLHALDLNYPLNGQLYVPTLTAYNQCKANSNYSEMLLWYRPETTGDPPSPRAAHAACVVGKKMYIFGGNRLDTNVANDLYCLDTQTMKWTQIITQGRGPSPRSYHSMTTINDRDFIVFGGNNDRQSFNDLYIFNTETFTWLKINDRQHGSTPPLARGGHCAVCINHKQLLVFGGGYNQKSLNDLHMFDIESRRWCRPSDTGILPNPRSGASCCLSASNNAMYIARGGDPEKDEIFADIYQLDTSYFTTDEKEISKLMYPAQEMNIRRDERSISNSSSERTNDRNVLYDDNIPNMESKSNDMPSYYASNGGLYGGSPAYYTPLSQANIISNDIGNTSAEVDLLIRSVETGIQTKINIFQQKQTEYAMLMKQIEAERNKLVNDVSRDISMLKYAVKESMDKLQQKFIAKMLRQHMDMASTQQKYEQQLLHMQQQQQQKYEQEQKIMYQKRLQNEKIQFLKTDAKTGAKDVQDVKMDVKMMKEVEKNVKKRMDASAKVFVSNTLGIINEEPDDIGNVSGNVSGISGVSGTVSDENELKSHSTSTSTSTQTELKINIPIQSALPVPVTVSTVDYQTTAVNKGMIGNAVQNANINNTGVKCALILQAKYQHLLVLEMQRQAMLQQQERQAKQLQETYVRVLEQRAQTNKMLNNKQSSNNMFNNQRIVNVGKKSKRKAKKRKKKRKKKYQNKNIEDVGNVENSGKVGNSGKSGNVSNIRNFGNVSNVGNFGNSTIPISIPIQPMQNNMYQPQIQQLQQLTNMYNNNINWQQQQNINRNNNMTTFYS